MMYNLSTERVDHQEIITLRNAYRKKSPPNWTERIKTQLMEDFTYHSSRIEGLELNYGDTVDFLRTGIVRGHERLKDISDLRNHQDVLKEIFASFHKVNLDVNTIQRLHRELMKDPVQWTKLDAYSGGPGEFKRENNYGYRGLKGSKEYMWWMEVPKAMKALCDKTNEGMKSDATLISSIHDFHYEFVNVIHPFGDGNGRMVRLLHNLLLLKSGFPILIIREEEKKAYIESMIRQEEYPEEKAFDKFMTQKLAATLKERLNMK